MKKFPIILLLIHSLFQLTAQINEKVQLANEYYQQGDYEKASELFEDLKDNKQAIPLIHSNYFELLLINAEFKEAEKYLNNIIRLFPSNLQFKSNMLSLYKTSGQIQKKEKYMEYLMESYNKSKYQLNMVAQNLVSQQLLDEAIQFIEEARKIADDPYAFSLDMAGIYRMKNNKKLMTNEYLNYARSNPINVNYVKNIFQNILREDDDLDYLEQSLISKVQQEPGNYLFADLLIWVELQRKNFYGAFVQARSLDKKKNTKGDECMRIGQIAINNKSWDEAIEIFEYISDTYKDTYNYAIAKRYLIRAKEQKIKTTYPVSKEEIVNLIEDYDNLISQIGENQISLEAKRNKALLYAFYLDQKDSAIFLLRQVIDNPRSSPQLISRAKLDLGDIYLLEDKPWESTLLYSQVEKSNKESQIGYDAKLRNARLNYYTGNFELAKSHLDILKLATTREISNDAIALSLLISNNTLFDTTKEVMQEFANIELLIYQNKQDEAISRLISLQAKNPTHPITDEVYLLLSKLYQQKGQFEMAVSYLDKILETYSKDILADDALFKKAEIYEKDLKSTQQAIDLYTDFLVKFPGSLYAAEARKNIRDLRGDFVN